VSHTDPEFLALTALGEHAGTAQDAAHLAQCADCQLELERLTRTIELARRDGPVSLEQPPASVWERIAATVGAEEAGQLDAAPGNAVSPEAVRAAANGSGRDVPARIPAGVHAGASPGRAGSGWPWLVLPRA
jgi:hypothetical protein